MRFTLLMGAAPTELWHTVKVLTHVSLQGVIVLQDSESLPDLSDVDSGAHGEEQNRAKTSETVKSKRSSNAAESTAEPGFTLGDLVWCKCVPLASFTDHFFLLIVLQCSFITFC